MKIGEDANLCAAWDFQCHDGSAWPDRVAGRVLRAMHGRVVRVEMDGPQRFGRWCARIEYGGWLRVPRAELGGLDIHGAQPWTVVAWVKHDSDRLWQFICGVWNERMKRQYALFTHGAWASDWRTWERRAVRARAMGYVSHGGHHTPGHPACFSYATGGTELRVGEWYCLACTYDLQALRVYVNGELDECEGSNPFMYGETIYDGGVDGGDFTVAQRCYRAWEGYPEAAPPDGEGFSGWISGIAVYRRALRGEEIRALALG
ncbi:MAG: LamG domain-containing protein [bacterium]|nr:LamG domain-containing protein [bacterium]